MTRRPHIVCLTNGGVGDFAGDPRLARLVEAMAERGDHRFTICSLEEDRNQPRGSRRRLRAKPAGNVRWKTAAATPGADLVSVIRELRRLWAMAEQVVDADGAELLHARGIPAAFVARRIGVRHRIPYLVDTGIDGGTKEPTSSRWSPAVIGRRAGEFVEQTVYRHAAAAVVPTREGAESIRRGERGRWPADRPLEVIPSCVDYSEFGLGGLESGTGISEVPDEIAEASVVIGCVGDGGEATPIEESIRLFDHVLQRRPDAHFVGLFGDPRPLLSEIETARIPATNYTVKPRDDLDLSPWLKAFDWGLLLRDDRGETSAVCRRLGQCFATGIQPVYRGGNPDVRRWIRETKSGLVLDSLDEQSLRDAAERIADTTAGLESIWEARWRTRSHFGLQSTSRRVVRLYDEILSRHRQDTLQVLFLTEGETAPSSRYRVQQLVPHLERRNIACRVRSAYGDKYNRWADTPAGPVYKLACRLKRIPQSLDAGRFDCVVLQRPSLPFSALAERLAARFNDRAIFDVDDAVFATADGTVDKRRRETFEDCARHSVHVICGNEYLAEHTREFADTTVIPTVVDTDVYRPAEPGGSDGDEVIVGWMGTPSNFRSLETISGVLRQLVSRRDDLRVRLVSSRRFEPLDDLEDVEQIQWSGDTEVELLQSFDIGLMPLVDNVVTRGKCGFKAIQYMAVRCPVVASPVGVNERLLSDPPPGFSARAPGEFEKAIARLADDPGLRRRFGHNGRARVERSYSVDAVIDRYVELFEQVARGGADEAVSSSHGADGPDTNTGGAVAFR